MTINGTRNKRTKNELRERRKKAVELRSLNRPEEEWTKPQLNAMCPYKKAPGDKGLPDSLPLLQQCWRERRGRLSPPLSPGVGANSDNESNEDKPSALPPPMGTTPVPASSITFNSPVDDVSTITEITIQEASGRSEERVADCEQVMMQRIEM
jgi:hypothetical protein